MKTLPRPVWFAGVLVLSFLIFVLPPAINESFRWTDASTGFSVGCLFQGMIWVPCVMVPTLIAGAVCSVCKWPRFWIFWCLLPAVIMTGFSSANPEFHTPTLDERMFRYLKVHAPTSASEVRVRYEGGQCADYSDVYFFKCSREDTDRLIRELKLTRDERAESFSFDEKRLPGWPNPASWSGKESYRGDRNDGDWFYTLHTDGNHGQVYIDRGLPLSGFCALSNLESRGQVTGLGGGRGRRFSCSRFVNTAR